MRTRSMGWLDGCVKGVASRPVMPGCWPKDSGYCHRVNASRFKEPQRVRWGSAHGAALRGRIFAAQCLQMHICLHKFGWASMVRKALVFSRAPSEGGGLATSSNPMNRKQLGALGAGSGGLWGSHLVPGTTGAGQLPGSPGGSAQGAGRRDRGVSGLSKGIFHIAGQGGLQWTPPASADAASPHPSLCAWW